MAYETMGSDCFVNDNFGTSCVMPFLPMMTHMLHFLRGGRRVGEEEEGGEEIV